MLRAPRKSREYLARIAGVGSIGRYGIIGLSGLVIDFGIFVGLLLVGASPIVANIVSSTTAISQNYVLNSWLNFQRKVSLISGLRFFSIGFAGLFLATLLLHLVTLTGASAIVAKLVVLPAVLIAQFVGNKAWTFRIP